MGATGAIAAFAGISSLSSISTAYSESQALRSAGDYRANVAETNAKLAGIQADQVLEAGDISASRKNLATRGLVGSIRASQGASGVDVASGSGALTRISAEYAGKIDEMTIRNNAARRAWGFKTQAMQDTFDAQFERMTANTKAQQTILTGGLQAIEKPLGIYGRYKMYDGGFRGKDTPFDMSTASGTRELSTPYKDAF